MGTSTTTTTTTTTATPTKGLIISGGFNSIQSVEVYIPSTGQHCELPDMPDGRHYHSMEGMEVCGGDDTDTQTSCLSLTDEGTWETTTTLLERRDSHCSWASPSGTILMGGAYSRKTSEKIQEDGTSSYSFDLKYDTYWACAINLGSSVILTGGIYTLTTVSEYDEDGWVRDLPPLLQGRYNHGCTYYNNDEGIKTYLVSGGYTLSDYFSSTELLLETASAWVLAGELPSPRSGLRAANIDNKILITGGYRSSDYDEIFEFDPLTGQWKLVDRMIQARSYHAISVVNVEGLCV